MPIRTSVCFKDLVVFFKDFAEAGEVEGLIVLEKNERQIEFAIGQFKVAYFAELLLFLLSLTVFFDETLGERLSAIIRLVCYGVDFFAKKTFP